MSKPTRRASRPSRRLVPHKLHVTRQVSPGTRPEVIATVECERNGCTLAIEVCVRCQRYARIEKHKTGYTLLCRSQDEEVQGFEPVPLLAQVDDDDDE